MKSESARPKHPVLFSYFYHNFKNHNRRKKTLNKKELKIYSFNNHLSCLPSKRNDLHLKWCGLLGLPPFPCTEIVQQKLRKMHRFTESLICQSSKNRKGQRQEKSQRRIQKANSFRVKHSQVTLNGASKFCRQSLEEEGCSVVNAPSRCGSV